MKTLKRWAGLFVLWISGWKCEGELPPNKKFVMIAAPHTSNWDLVYMLAVAYVFRLDVSWLGKHTLFKGVFGWFMRWLGGIPVDRSGGKNYVEQIKDVFEQRETLFLAVPPAGTRSKRDYWKSGFYYIALAAQVPIVMGFLDFKRKVGGVGPSFVPSGDVKKDMDMLREFYSKVTGLHPENTSRIRLRSEDDESSDPDASKGAPVQETSAEKKE